MTWIAMPASLGSQSGRSPAARGLWRRLAAQPQRVINRLQRDARHTWGQMLDWRRSTYTPLADLRLARYFSPLPLDVVDRQRESILDRAQLHSEHCFDLLGSGWVRVRHGMRALGTLRKRFPTAPAVIADSDGRWLAGRINPANLPTARRVWRQVDDAGYLPIDWQIDFKSGYRWSERCWHAWTPLASLPGRDMKVPWELGRCQHLTTFVWAYAITGDERYTRELRNQVLDFVATNPPRYGIQWRCPMDVGIRIFNWLVAWDLARAYGVRDVAFERTLAASALDHGRYLAAHLEWSPSRRGNHYLANLAGLVAIAAYLPRSPETDVWLAVGVQQLIVETKRQFLADGTNFEASTGYHRLATELVLYSTALALAMKEDRLAALSEYDAQLWTTLPALSTSPMKLYPLPESRHDRAAAPTGVGNHGNSCSGNDRRYSPFPPAHFARLEQAAEFAVWTTRPSGRAHLVGDHDSGRLLKLQPCFRPVSGEQAACRHLRSDAAGDASVIAGVAADALAPRKVWWVEQHDDFRHGIAAAAGLFARQDLLDCCNRSNGEPWETELVRQLVRRRPPASQQREPIFWVEAMEGKRPTNSQPLEAAQAAPNGSGPTGVPHLTLAAQLAMLTAVPNIAAYSTRIELPGKMSGTEVFDQLAWRAWPKFGLCIWRSPRLYLAVRCGPVGQEGYGGHAHNDQLAVELMVDEQPWIADPGTFLYTPDVTVRNAWRSAAAHYVPRPVDGREPAPLDAGLFELPDTTQAECLYAGQDGFLGVHYGYGQPVWRAVLLCHRGIEITDLADASLPLAPPPPVSAACSFRPSVPHAPGYGILARA